MYYLLLTLFIIVALLLVIVVLMQRSRGDVGSAFGGMGQGVFGPGGVDTILTKITYWLAFSLMTLAVLLALTHPSKRGSLIRDEGKGTPVQTQQGPPQGQNLPAGPPAQSKP
ncbi:MAG: preprotein translocase subunit SecG [Aquificaceae bacterium]